MFLQFRLNYPIVNLNEIIIDYRLNRRKIMVMTQLNELNLTINLTTFNITQGISYGTSLCIVTTLKTLHMDKVNQKLNNLRLRKKRVINRIAYSLSGSSTFLLPSFSSSRSRSRSLSLSSLSTLRLRDLLREPLRSRLSRDLLLDLLFE